LFHESDALKCTGCGDFGLRECFKDPLALLVEGLRFHILARLMATIRRQSSQLTCQQFFFDPQFRHSPAFVRSLDVLRQGSPLGFIPGRPGGCAASNASRAASASSNVAKSRLYLIGRR